MTDAKEIIDLEIIPIPPDTISSTEEEVLGVIERAIRDAGQDGLLSQKEIYYEIKEKGFPTEAVVVVTFVLATGVALSTYRRVILPELQRRFGVKSDSSGTGQH